ncbi:hypothetical protein ACFE04_016508 [Oxalis oulophora]
MASLILFCFTLVVFASPFVSSNDGKLSAHKSLQRYNFPIGLLPKGITGYELESSTGKFSAEFNGSCSFAIESYELKYEPTVSGVITKNKINNLKGISVKVLLLWLNIVEVSRKGEDLEFSVGISSAEFPVKNFEDCPQCGCGFNCNMTRGFLSSI